MLYVRLQLGLILLGFGQISVLASPDTHELWKGADQQILNEALSGLPPIASNLIQKQFAVSNEKQTLEQKLWVVIDHIVEDEENDYETWYISSAFATVGSKRVATNYSAKKARSLIAVLKKKVREVEHLASGVSGDSTVVVKDEFTGEMVKTSKSAIEKKRRTRFLGNVLLGTFNILLLNGSAEDIELTKPFKKSSESGIRSMGLAIESAMREKWNLNSQKAEYK